MAVTGWRIRQHLPDDLVGVVLDYVCPIGLMDPGMTGLHELCMIKPTIHVVVSAAREGYAAILRDVWPLVKVSRYDKDTVLRHAGRGGDADTIELALSLHPNGINDCMGGACREGRIELVKQLIERGARAYTLGLGYACEGKHRGCIDLMRDHTDGRCWCCGKFASDHA